MNESLKKAVEEAATVLDSVGGAETAPAHCLLRKASWSPAGDAVSLHCELEVPDPRDVPALHGADPRDLARELGVPAGEEIGGFLAKMHAASVESSMEDWASSRASVAQAPLSNMPFEAEDGTLFKVYPDPLVRDPVIDEEDGDSRVMVFAIKLNVDILPPGTYAKAEGACDARFPGWRSVDDVEFEPGLDDKGAYLDGSMVIGGRVWNVWVTDFPEGIDAGFFIGAKASDTTFAKKQGFKSFPQCLSWVQSVIDGIKAGAYDGRAEEAEGRGR